MKDLAGFDAALGAFGRFLGQITAKIRHVAKMEVGTAKRAVGITIHDLACGTKSLAESSGFAVAYVL